MTDYTQVATLDDVAPGKMFRVEVEGKRILLANTNGTIYACDEMCTHEDFSLALGALQGDCLKCSLHGSRFDLKTGKPLDEPADEDLAVYPVKIEDNKIFVALG
jgi:3-phenylpropionate/trans-cinnamate dioxygenase ferredoxin subunit